MKLKELRQAKGMTQEELAKVIDVNVRSVNRWEKGQSDIYLQKAIKIARFFEVSLDEFVK
ncbi:putative transcriptional regulator [Streptococcus sp. 45]|uniref:Putative transcriptional regulator n=2 Tax=Streptococcus TaxID=1301 RepID=A0A7Z7KAS4_STRAG|nr:MULTISPECIES: helix-turn-helix transcriptional regulator [Streptococcus]EFV96561.1 DNA-binding helix-turn-helix protein [Streptococcus agalactiae ATCC 13813]KLL32321.1 XRE family transcriptional regulator [Streptococcus agalactiae]PHU32224.1 XRE family transcriptional regulator [Streptococcus agalactiae]SDQ44226.1 putative transcriptional regulator [Streptococcus equinus]SEI94402.1 putative transcriptional regulator [Streptococcus sp. 45]